MAKLDYLIEELVTGNRILAREGVVDSFGHISVRLPGNPQRYLLSRSRAPDCIEADDIMEFTLDGARSTAADARLISSGSSTARSMRRGRTSCQSSTTTAKASFHSV